MGAGEGAAGTVRLLDVSDLAPPEPFERAVEALDALSPGEALQVRHHREPRLLYPLLEGRGFRQITLLPRPGEVHVLVWRDGDPAAETAARAAAATVTARPR